MVVIRGAAVVPAAAPTRTTSGGRPSGGRFVRTLFYVVGIAAGLSYVAGRLRDRGAPGVGGSDRLSLIEERLARVEMTPDRPPVSPAEARIADDAHERRLAALERRLTTVERTREARLSLLRAKPNGNGNGTSRQDRRHG